MLNRNARAALGEHFGRDGDVANRGEHDGEMNLPGIGELQFAGELGDGVAQPVIAAEGTAIEPGPGGFGAGDVAA